MWAAQGSLQWTLVCTARRQWGCDACPFPGLWRAVVSGRLTVWPRGPGYEPLTPAGPARPDDPGQATALPRSLEVNGQSFNSPSGFLSAQTSVALPSLPPHSPPQAVLPTPHLCPHLSASHPTPLEFSFPLNPVGTPGGVAAVRDLCLSCPAAGSMRAVAPLAHHGTVRRAGHAADAQRALCSVTSFPAPTIRDTTQSNHLTLTLGPRKLRSRVGVTAYAGDLRQSHRQNLGFPKPGALDSWPLPQRHEGHLPSLTRQAAALRDHVFDSRTKKPPEGATPHGLPASAPSASEQGAAGCLVPFWRGKCASCWTPQGPWAPTCSR